MPLISHLMANELVQQIWRSPQVMKFRGGMTMVELSLGEKVPVVVGRLVARGTIVAVDAKSQGIVVLAHAQDAATCQEFFKKALTAAQGMTKRNGGKGIESTSYSGLDAYKIDKAVVVAIDDWLLVSNNGDLAKQIIDNYRQPTAQGLTSVESFADARTTSLGEKNPQQLLWGWADVAMLREAGAKKHFQRPQDNFVAELLIGGLLATVRDASTATVSLACHSNELQLQFVTPQSTVAKKPEYEFFFGPDGQGHGPPLISTGSNIAALSAHRDVAELWRRAGDMFGERLNDQLAQADATLTTLFSGRDFGEDILGAIEPGVQVIVTAQEFDSAKAPVPQIKLPAFALVSTLRKPDEMMTQLKRIFTSLVGFLNITGAMNQQPQLDIESIKEDGAIYVFATYALDVDRPKEWKVPIQFNFSPTLAMFGDQAVLASTGQIARDIVARLRDAEKSPTRTRGEAKDAAGAPNTLLLIDAAAATSALVINRDQLVSQNMIEKGHTQEEAQQEIDTLLSLLGLIESLEIRFEVGDQTALTSVLRLKP